MEEMADNSLAPDVAAEDKGDGHHRVDDFTHRSSYPVCGGKAIRESQGSWQDPLG